MGNLWSFVFKNNNLISIASQMLTLIACSLTNKMMFPISTCHRPPIEINSLCDCDLAADDAYNFSYRGQQTTD